MVEWLNKRKNYIFVFVFIIVSKMLFFLIDADYGINADRIGDLIAPTNIAGLDWGLLISHVNYYGYGFKWIFAPFFLLTDNPDFIYYGILSLCNVLFALTGMMIYHLEIKYLKVADQRIAVLLAVFMGILQPADMKSEPSLYMMGWIITFMIAKAITKQDAGYKIKSAVMLAIALAYCMTLHERMLAIILGFCIVLLVYRVVFKEWFVNPFVYYPSQMIFYFVVNLCNDLYRNHFWQTTDVKNSNVIPEDSTLYFMQGLEGFKIAVKCIWSNFVTLGTQTYGLGWIAVAFFFFSVIAFCKKRLNKNTSIVDKILVTFVWMGVICIAIIIAGLVMRWGMQVYQGELYGYKGFVYGRYYVNFAYPAILAIMIWMLGHNVKRYQIVCFWGAVTALIVGFLYKIFPVLEEANGICLPNERISTTSIEWILFGNIFENESVRFNLYINLVVIGVILLVVSWKLFTRKRTNHTIHFVLLTVTFFVFMTNTNSFHFAKPSVIFSGGAYEGTYEFFKNMENNNINLQKDTIYTDCGPWTLQYELNRYHVTYVWEEIGKTEDVLFVTCNPMEMTKEYIPWNDYYCLKITDTVTMYFMDKELAQQLEPLGYEIEHYEEDTVIEIPGLSRDYEFIVVNDLHLIVPNEEVGQEYTSLVESRMPEFTDKDGKKSSEIWMDMAKQIDNENADLVIFAGDMIDYVSTSNVDLLKRGMNTIDEPILYIRSDHDYSRHYTGEALSQEDALQLQLSLTDDPDVWTVEYDDMLILGINKSFENISKEMLKEIQEAFKKKKPILIVTHVPYDSPVDKSLRAASFSGRGIYNLWGLGNRYVPDENTTMLMEMIYDKDSPVVAVIAAHLHFPYQTPLSDHVQEYVCVPSYTGEYTKIKLVAE